MIMCPNSEVEYGSATFICKKLYKNFPFIKFM